jgi:hypothetical protein
VTFFRLGSNFRAASPPHTSSAETIFWAGDRLGSLAKTAMSVLIPNP